MTVSVNPAGPQKGRLVIRLTGVASTDNGGQGEVENPEGATLAVTRVFAHFLHGSTGVGNLSAGIGVTGAAPTDIASAMDVIEATVGGKVVHLPAVQVAETENPTALWHSTDVLGFTGSASMVGLIADVYVEYIRLSAS
jgi:hypothetical protein